MNGIHLKRNVFACLYIFNTFYIHLLEVILQFFLYVNTTKWLFSGQLGSLDMTCQFTHFTCLDNKTFMTFWRSTLTNGKSLLRTTLKLEAKAAMLFSLYFWRKLAHMISQRESFCLINILQQLSTAASQLT